MTNGNTFIIRVDEAYVDGYVMAWSTVAVSSMGNEKPPVVAKAPQRRCEIPSEEVLTDLAKEIESKSGSKSEKPLLFREKRVYRRKDNANYFSRK